MERRYPTVPIFMVLAALMLISTYALAGAAEDATALMAQQRWSDAAKALDRQLLASPDDATLHLKRGRCALGRRTRTTGPCNIVPAALM